MPTERTEASLAGMVAAFEFFACVAPRGLVGQLHYLVALERRPAALDYAPVLRQWSSPESFARLRQNLVSSGLR